MRVSSTPNRATPIPASATPSVKCAQPIGPRLDRGRIQLATVTAIIPKPHARKIVAGTPSRLSRTVRMPHSYH